ncbi:hypothetical protein ACU4GA_01055 [Methylobacterium oryzae CBMB20]
MENTADAIQDNVPLHPGAPAQARRRAGARAEHGLRHGLPRQGSRGRRGDRLGPAYRPETSFAQPGTPPTPGAIAGRAYRARTGHGVYDQVQGDGLYRGR